MRRHPLRATTLVAVGVLLLVGAACEPMVFLEARSWAEVAPWDHSWDAADTIGYLDDGAAYGTGVALRVSSVPDAAGTTPLQRDDGSYQRLFRLPPAPGPRFDAGSVAFGGHPSWRSENIYSSATYFDNFHTMLSPQTDKDDRAQWFGWDQAWWGAMLVAPVASDGGNEDVAIDGDPGMTTMVLQPTVSMTTWLNVINTGPEIDSGVALADGQSALIVWQVDGPRSWIDVTFRDATGVHTSHVTGAQAVGVLNVLHTGWSHMNETATLGLARGTCDDAQLAELHLWAGPYLTTAP